MKHILTYTFFLVFCVAFGSNTIYGQDIEFIRVIPDDGTNFSRVNDIIQDKDGFMWFATEKGLYKYDGNKLIHFEHDSSNPNSISADGIRALYAETNGDIWVGSMGEGLYLYHNETGIFTHFEHDSIDTNSITNNAIHDILRDNEGILWIATSGGLDQYDPKTKGFIHFQPDENDSTSLSDWRVRKLYEDRQGTLWIGTGHLWKNREGGDPEYGGLNRYNRETGTFTQYRHKAADPQSLASNKISAIFEDNKGVLWIGTDNNGLHQMDRNKGTFKQIMYDPAHPQTFGNTEYEDDIINFISQDTTGGYWMGKFRSGLFYFNPVLGKMFQFNRTSSVFSGFRDESAMVAFTSRDGVLWIGGREGELYRVNRLHREIPQPFVSNAPVNSLYEEEDGTLWIGKNNDLMRVDKKTGDTLRFDSQLKMIKDSNSSIWHITKDLEGNLWVAASSGLLKWDADNNKFIGYHHDPKNENSISDPRATGIFEDSQNNFWVGTFQGLNLMDRKTGTFSHFNVLTTNIITSIIEDKSGDVWISSFGGGIYRYNRQTKTFTTYLDRSNIKFIYEDSDGILWAGGDKGLYTYKPDLDDFVLLGDSYALTGTTDVINMVEDNHKNLWIGTSDAIIRLNPQRNATSVFGESFGVKNGSLSIGAPLKGKNGDIYFGNQTGYYQFNPVDLAKNANPSEIFFTRFFLFDKEVLPSNAGPLKENLQKIKEIKLPFNQNVFSIDFTLIDYINPEDTRMFYYLENYDGDWIPSYSARKASYFNVPPGHYVFHVKGVNSDGVWAEKSMKLIILPPWYRTWLAFVIYALLFITVVFAFDRIQRKRIIRKERMKTQERELAQAKEIEKAYFELEKAHSTLKSTQSQLIQSEKMASLGELTAGIAHEIQNPLNFVNNFSEVSKELIVEMNDELAVGNIQLAKEIAGDIEENLEKINHHGKRAADIVKGMLQHSRTSSGVKEPTDINALADEYLRLAYHGLRAKDKSFNANMETDFDESVGNINIVPQDIGRVILNLITNAFYAVNEKKQSNKEGYEPVVSIGTKKLGDKVEIKVRDNGNGIPKSVLDKIFQPFFTTKPTGQGTGLGLSLSYDIVKAHGGELKVETNEGEGSEFIIQLSI